MAVEACEYDRTFLELSPRGGIITNLEADHLDYYGSMEALEGAFARFAAGIDPRGLLVLSSDAPDFLREAACCEVWTLGREYDVELHGEDRGHFSIRIVGPGWASGVVRLQVPGRFNVDNAAAAVALAVGLSARGDNGLDQALLAEHAARGVARYEGTKRRFESWGQVQGVQVVHDYAHHPTEVSVTLEAARRVFPGMPLHVMFQPHQASRTERFLNEFIDSLRGAERVVVADVYGARQTIDGRQAGAEDLAVGLRRAGLDASVTQITGCAHQGRQGRARPTHKARIKGRVSWSHSTTRLGAPSGWILLLAGTALPVHIGPNAKESVHTPGPDHHPGQNPIGNNQIRATAQDARSDPSLTADTDRRAQFLWGRGLQEPFHTPAHPHEGMGREICLRSRGAGPAG